MQWLEKKTGPPAVEVNDLETLNELKKNNAVVVIGFFKDKESDMAKAFVEAAGAIDEHKILITSNDKVMADDAKDGSIFLFKDFDEPKAEYAGDAVAKVIHLNAVKP